MLLGLEAVVLLLQEVFSRLVIRTTELVMAKNKGHFIIGHCMDADSGRSR